MFRRISSKGLMPPQPDPPNEYLCPISLNLMNDPVISADGHSYERKEIEFWFASHRKSPKTGNDLSDLRLIPNIALRQLIDDFRTKHGLPVPQLPRTPPQTFSSSSGSTLSVSYRADIRFDILRNSIGPNGMTVEEAEILGLVITAHQSAHFDELAKRLRTWASSPPHTLVFISEVTAFARNHAEQRVRRELIGQLPEYVAKHEGMHALYESTLNHLMQCAEHDESPSCRKRAIEACFALFKSCSSLHRTVELAAFYLRQLPIEIHRADGGEAVSRSIISYLGQTDKITGVVEARPEYAEFLSLSLVGNTAVAPRTPAGAAAGAAAAATISLEDRRDREMVLLAIQCMNCYQQIPARYARSICEILLAATDSLDIRKVCVTTLLSFAKKLDPLEYVGVRDALLTAGRVDGELIIKWMVLAGVCELRDASEGVIGLLVENLSNKAKDFLWWNSICNAAATSVNRLLDSAATGAGAVGAGASEGSPAGSSLVAFPPESLRVIDRERDALLSIMDKERSGGRFTYDVVQAAAGLLRKADPTIPIHTDEGQSSGCAVC